MGLLFWPLLGAAIGAYAAQRKGFSTVGGVIGGMMLGPLAFLLFFVSGVVSSKEQQRKCPFCAEWVRPEAVVCKHCHKDLPTASPTPAASRPATAMRMIALVAGAVVVTFIVLVGLIIGGPTLTSVSAPTVTMAEFSGLQTGMTYEQAVKIIGGPGEEISRSDIADIKTVMYQWKNGDGSNMNAMFQNGGLINKAQFGLR